ncbi:MAG: type IV pilus twitching motility protein PilT [Planctomycetes bacterium]|nr:type IV pilus twitching motility protein PilT [Planctomycetota bacterium]
MAKIDDLFQLMVHWKASDLHMSSGSPPMFRIDGQIVPHTDAGPNDTAALQEMVFEIMSERNRQEFEKTNDTDFAYELAGIGRYRCNVFRDRYGIGAVFRTIPSRILTVEDLGLPPPVLQFCDLSKGLVVVTGPTGSGKSTTLAAMVDRVNKSRYEHILTIEDPIEFVHQNQCCLINQREVGVHTQSFKRALRAALREDPNVILIGEMRDLETIEIAIETAETGHLVFGTLHTTTAASTVDRLIDQFPADRQAQIRTMLSTSLKGVVAQTLLRKIGGGRVAALELLVVTSAISSMIREGKTYQIGSAMQTGGKYGMFLLNDSLQKLVQQRIVEPQEAYLKAIDKDDITKRLQAIGATVKVE